MHFLRNPEPGLYFALLTDFPDADSETLPEDEGLVSYAISVICELNAKYERSIPEPSSTAGEQSTLKIISRKTNLKIINGRLLPWKDSHFFISFTGKDYGINRKESGWVGSENAANYRS